MYESSNELLKLTQKSSVRIQTHARIAELNTAVLCQFCVALWGVSVPQRLKGRPSRGGTVQNRRSTHTAKEYVQRLHSELRGRGRAAGGRGGRVRLANVDLRAVVLVRLRA